MTAKAKETFLFAEFAVDADRRRLVKNGETLALNPKAFDLLLVLIENRGQIVSKEELLETVWANQFVEENNLTVHISALRKALGETKNEKRFLVTIPGKGYKFVAEVRSGVDDEFDNRIVIENHSFARIVVAENETAILPENYQPQFLTAAPKGWRKNLLYAGIFGSFLIFTTFGGGYLWRQNQQTNAPSFAAFAQPQIKQLTTNGKVSIAALSPDGKLFAYVVNDFGERSLWLGNVAGGNHLLLRPPAAARYFTLAFAPDSCHLYFSLKDEQNPNGALYRTPVSGGVHEKIMDAVDNFSLAPDGSRIAFGRSSAGEAADALFVMNLDGSEKREIAAFPKERSFVYDSLSWSPDNAQIALSATKNDAIDLAEVVIVNIADKVQRRVNHQSWREIAKTAWLKDGSGLIVTAIKDGFWSSVPQYRIFHIEINSGEAREITSDLNNYTSSLNLSAADDLLLTVEHKQLNNVWIAPADDLSRAKQITFGSFGKYDGLWGMDFAPDGKIIYTNSDTQSQFISQMNADGTNSKPLTAPGTVDSCLKVSNDGRHIVFHSNRAGDFDVWRMDIDGGSPQQLTFGNKNFQPFISADNRWVYYKSRERNTGELRRVPMTGDGAPEILNETETSWGSASPDGRFFAASYITDKTRLAVFSAETNEVIKQFELPPNGTLFTGSRWTPDSRAVIYRDNFFGYWQQDIDGGEPRRLIGLPKEKFYNFAFSKDGKQFAFVRGAEMRDVVLLKNKVQ